MKFIKQTLALIIILGMTLSTTGNDKKRNQSKKPNIVFIIVDDLKPVLGCYGDENVKTPGIDNLAKNGVIFDNAYCQQAVCAPSRISLFTGLRPDRTQVTDLKTNMRDKNPKSLTLPQYFKQNGYETVGLGKLMHGAKNNDPISWSLPYLKDDELTYAKGYEYPAQGKYQNPEAIEAYKDAKQQKLKWKETVAYLRNKDLLPSVENQDVPDNAYVDGAIAANGIELLDKLSNGDKPFFLALGFNRPHLPFSAPKKYWDLYDRDDISIHPFQEKAKNSPDFAYHPWGELRNYSDIPKDGPLTEEKQKELIHGYRASVSFVDAQIGKVTTKLKELGIDDNTIIVLFGDHGWHLGDHGLWCKHSNFEQATKIPFIMSAPGFAKGKRTTSMTELVDIFPTLAEYAGLEAPNNLEGESLIPVLKNPSLNIKDFAISQYPRGNNTMGYSLRTERYRLTLWLKGDYKNTELYKNPLIEAIELYDYSIDPNETQSLANNPAYKATVGLLKNKLLTELNNAGLQTINSKVNNTENAKTDVIFNETFDTSFSQIWKPIVRNGANINFNVELDASMGCNALKVSVFELGANPWDAQMITIQKYQFKQGQKLTAGFKYKGNKLKLILTSDQGKNIVRKLEPSNELKEQIFNITVPETGNYSLKIQYLETGEYLIDDVQISKHTKNNN